MTKPQQATTADQRSLAAIGVSLALAAAMAATIAATLVTIDAGSVGATPTAQQVSLNSPAPNAAVR